MPFALTKKARKKLFNTRMLFSKNVISAKRRHFTIQQTIIMISRHVVLYSCRIYFYDTFSITTGETRSRDDTGVF